MTPEAMVGYIDFRYITDALTPAEARELWGTQTPTRAERMALILRNGYPAYTTSAGWLDDTDEHMLEDYILGHARTTQAVAPVRVANGAKSHDFQAIIL